MAGTPKLLARQLLGSSITDVGGPTGGKVWTVETIQVTSVDASNNRTVNLHHQVSGDGSSSDSNALAKASPLYAGDAWEFGRGISFGSGDKLTGLCSSASKALVSIYGIEHLDTRCKLLARGLMTGSIADLGSAVPAAKAWKLGLIHIASLEATLQRTFYLHHRAAADSDDLSNMLFYGAPIVATDFIEAGKGFEMAVSDKFKGYADSASKVMFHAYGVEYTP